MEYVMSGRRPRRLLAQVLIAGLLGAALATVGFVGTAVADTINYTGQGTTNGACGEFEGPAPQPGGTQTWQFNLTQTQAGATMSASFSDGTSVTNIPESDHNGKTSFWFITTATGATVTSASANFTPDGPNSQFVVSHCTAGGTPPPPTTAGPGGGTEVGGITAERPGQAGAAVAVTTQPRFTG